MSESRERPDRDAAPEGDEQTEETTDAASDDPYDIESDFGPDGNPVNSAE